jgi:hypothetical protein
MSVIGILPQQSIDIAEQHILTKLSTIDNNYFSISNRFIERANKLFTEMSLSSTQNGSYCIFAEDSFGYITYGFYKSLNGKIYIIISSLNQISSVKQPIDLDWLKVNTM